MANFNFNKVILGGRLTADPELRTTATGVSVVSFTVAVTSSTALHGELLQNLFPAISKRQVRSVSSVLSKRETGPISRDRSVLPPTL